MQGLDWSRGYVCGTMEALNVPGAKSPIVTFWEGHVVDNVNHTFYTRGWGAARETDMRHWCVALCGTAVAVAVAVAVAEGSQLVRMMLMWYSMCMIAA